MTESKRTGKKLVPDDDLPVTCISFVMSTLATVVDSNQQNIADWNPHKAPLDAPLTQFHAKFWGVEEEGG